MAWGAAISPWMLTAVSCDWTASQRCALCSAVLPVLRPYDQSDECERQLASLLGAEWRDLAVSDALGCHMHGGTPAIVMTKVENSRRHAASACYM